MEIIRISENKLKLILDSSDMKKYGLTERTLSQNPALRRRSLGALLEEVKRKTGVDAALRRAVLEAFPDKAGGAEIFVTVLERECAARLYRFTSLLHLSAAVRCLEKGEGDASLYSLGEGEYFLTLPVGRTGGDGERYAFFTEYGEEKEDPLFLPYIREYGTCLCEGDALRFVMGKKENFSV